MSKLTRKNIFMSNQIADWYEQQSEITGMSQSNLMVMALHQFMKEQKAFNMMEQYTKLAEQIEVVKDIVGSMEENNEV